MVFNDQSALTAGVSSQAVKDLEAQLLSKAGLRVLGWQQNGFVQLMNSAHPIATPDDLKGLKIRVIPGSAPLTAAFKLLGAQPVPIDATEEFTAEQAGTIQGNEDPIPIFVANKDYEALKYLTLVNFGNNPAPVVINNKFYESLPADLQQVLQTAESMAVTHEEALEVQTTAADLKIMEAAGVQVTDDTAPALRAPFVTAINSYIKSVDGSTYPAALFAAFGVQ
jgi:TRAP-type C4-dicarboxylate transport system substrate-binding protein